MVKGWKMAERIAPGEQNDTPEDVATLYSWANLHGAKYRDFSATRAQTRESTRQRVEETIETERQRAREMSEAEVGSNLQSPAQADRVAEPVQQSPHQASLAAAHRAVQEAEQRAADLAGQLAAQQSAIEELVAHEVAERSAQGAEQQAAEQRVWQHPRPDRLPTAPAPDPVTPQPTPQYYPPPQSAFQRADTPGQPPPAQVFGQPLQGYAQQPPAFRGGTGPSSGQLPSQGPVPSRVQGPVPAQAEAPVQVPTQASIQDPAHEPKQAPSQQRYEPVREESVGRPSPTWASQDFRETGGRPAWLTPERVEPPSQPAPPPAMPPVPEDTLQGSRDRLASRWFALRGVFAGGPAPVETAPVPVASRAPVMAVFSLAGGVGKTSLAATLGRALSSRGERILLVDTAAFGLLPFFFGARDQRPGLLRTFSPPGVSSDAPIQLVTIDPETLGPEAAGSDANGQNTLSGEIGRNARGGVSRVIVDLATASGATTRRVMRMAPMILVPVLPDMNSVVSVSSIDDFFEHNSATGNKVPLYYVLNQFDPSLPLHLDVREVLREQLGDRLLPFALRRAPAVSEALAEGMTVMDYAPNSTVAEDFGTLAGWVKSLSAPASTSYRGVRWSER